VKSNKGSFFEGLARNCANHPWRVVMIWAMLLAIALALFLTIFNKNMTTATEFTTDTDSRKSENLFKQRFPQAGYKQENCVITSNTYTADDPEFWTYVDGLWARLGNLRDREIVKDVQYYDPVLREGVPLVPPVLEQMVAAMQLILEGYPTSEQLLQASDALKASGAELRAAAYAFPADSVTGNGEMGLEGMLQAADGADEIAGTLLLADALQKTYDALLPVTQGAVLTNDVREATVTDLKAMATRLSAAAASLEATGPGTADRPTLVSGLRQFGEQGPMLAAMYEAKYAAQLGRDFAVMLTSDNLPTAAAVNAVVVDMQATGTRLTAMIAYVEQTVPDSETRQTLLDGLYSAADQMNMYGTTVMPILARAIEYAETGYWGDAAEAVLKAGLGMAKGFMQQQIATAEDGLRQMQEQTGAQIGQVADGIATLQGQFSTQLPTAIEGLRAARDGMMQAAGLVSTDGHTALFVINMSENGDEAAKYILEVRQVVLTGNGIGIDPETSFEDGFRVRMVGGTNVSRDMQDVAFSDLTKSLVVAIPIALVVLLLVFGALGAALLPIVLSLVSIMVALGIAAVVGTWVPLNFAIENIVFMLGLAVGIDHALFFAYRYREERRKGHDKIEAIARSGAAASHAIFYAGIIVAIALFGILMIPCNMHRSLAMGAIMVVAVLTPATITLLPAVLSLIGNGFDFGRLPWQKRMTDPLPPHTEGRGFWHWVTLPAMKAPVISFVLAAMVVAACIWPRFSMKLGYSYVDTLPPNCVSRSGYDAMMEAGYPNMLVAPLEIAISGYDQPAVRAETEALVEELEASGDFVTAVPLAVNEKGDVAWKRVFLNMDPFTEEASDTVRALRNDYIGDNFKDAGGAAYVSGYGAFNNDFVDTTANYTTPVLVFVMGLSLVLLLVAFRSVLLAVILSAFNLASVYAAYGMVVFVFQGGHNLGLPYTRISGIDAYVPIFLLCGLLAISMDYFVFMVARVRERYGQTENLSDAIPFAFRRSGLVVLGAAAVMLVVFMAFSISKIVIVAELGFGMFAAILLDATVITLVLSPATMRLLGKWYWWWPSWLAWVPDLRARPANEVEP
jgi:putative drug exporter of the RND superfamily